MKRNRRLVGLALTLLLLPALQFAAADAGAPPTFHVGEVLRYRLYWGFVPVGQSVASTDWTEHEGRRLLRVRFRTTANKVLDKIYPVDDLLETLIDPDDFLPVRFVKRLNEGRYHCDEVTTFDHENGRATWHDRLNDRTRQYEIGPSTRDLLTFIYLLRNDTLPVGARRSYRVMADEKIYDLLLRVRSAERIRAKSGRRYDTVLVEPRAAFEGLFVRKGEMRLWISSDDRPTLIRMNVEVPVASVSVVLDKIETKGTELTLHPDVSGPEAKAEAVESCQPTPQTEE